ncbi:hypothetical protein HUU39_06080 [candidate division KSB1 bacterium]|nr:hypothetical protein [bacterium]NUM64828.1 hypothetical protein [candidate division KSB1 bacterium]
MPQKKKDESPGSKSWKQFGILLGVLGPVVAFGVGVGRYLEEMEQAWSRQHEENTRNHQADSLQTERIAEHEKRLQQFERQMLQASPRVLPDPSRSAFEDFPSAFEIPFGQTPHVKPLESVPAPSYSDLPPANHQAVDDLLRSITILEYGAALRANPDLEGVLTFECHVQPDGRLSWVQMKYTSGLSGLAERIRNRMRSAWVSNASGTTYQFLQSYELRSYKKLEEERSQIRPE